MLLHFIITLIISFSIGLKPDKNNTQSFREVILFAYANDDLLLKKQLEILNSDPKGLAERDLKISVKIWGQDKKASHQQYKIAKYEYAFVLVGKDGGEKYRSFKLVTQQKLYAIIDAMPMRAIEMRKQNNK